MRCRSIKKLLIVLILLIVSCGISIRCYELVSVRKRILDYKDQLILDLSTVIRLNESVLANDSTQDLTRIVMQYCQMEAAYFSFSPTLHSGAHKAGQWETTAYMIIDDFVNWDFSEDLSINLSEEEREVLKKIDTGNKWLYEQLQADLPSEVVSRLLTTYHDELKEIVDSYHNRWTSKLE